jgi:hypothetical protein
MLNTQCSLIRKIHALGFIPSVFLSLVFCLAFILSACDSNGLSGPDAETHEPVSVSLLPIRHLHMGSAGFQAEVRNDLPESLIITLNSIPGKMGGSPQNEDAFVQTLSSQSTLRVPWDSLIAGGHLGVPALYADSMPVASVTPATVRMMRIGTFADALEWEDLYPDSQALGYGFYSLKYQLPVVALYFDGPTRLNGMTSLCDGTPVSADASVPKAGLYFFTSQFNGSRYAFSPLADTENLVFAVSTFSQAYVDFSTAFMARTTCTTE